MGKETGARPLEEGNLVATSSAALPSLPSSQKSPPANSTPQHVTEDDPTTSLPYHRTGTEYNDETGQTDTGLPPNLASSLVPDPTTPSEDRTPQPVWQPAKAPLGEEDERKVPPRSITATTGSNASNVGVSPRLSHYLHKENTTTSHSGLPSRS
ncbi:hypothetical protein BT69DRAFT_1336883 [Atractiella rhizophila]|nr:hypothetical protein BT69DRAFT_1336883 [Atractiella rhizophila]